jgi:hypothetical protein
MNDTQDVVNATLPLNPSITAFLCHGIFPAWILRNLYLLLTMLDVNSPVYHRLPTFSFSMFSVT